MFSEVKVGEIRKNEKNLTRVVIRYISNISSVETNETKPLCLTNLSGADYTMSGSDF